MVNSRSKRISIKMDNAKRQMIVSAPSERHLPAARRFVKEKTDWIAVQLETLPRAYPFIKGQSILYRGEMTQLISPEGRGRARYDAARFDEDSGAQIAPPRLVIPAPEGALEGRARRYLIREAREALTTCTHYHAEQLSRIMRPVTVTKITVRDTRSRWGSCTPDGHISYSWRLICAPPFVLDYVAAHEVSHLIEANHSRDFWDVVDRLVDTVRPAKKWLRDHGADLHAVGAAH